MSATGARGWCGMTDSHAGRDEHAWLWLLLVAIGGWLLWLLSPILTPFLIGALFAYLGDPLVDRLEARRFPRTLAVMAVFSGFVLLLLAMVLVIVPVLDDQLSLLLAKLPEYAAWVRSHVLPWLRDTLGLSGGFTREGYVQKLLTEYGKEAGGLISFLVGSVSRSGLALVELIANLFLIPVITFYLLRDWDDIVAGVHSLLPRRIEPRIVRLARESDEMLGSFLRGQMLVMLGLGIIYTTGLWLVGLQFALLIGMLAGLVSFVPYLGLVIGTLVAGIAAILQAQGPVLLPWVALVFVVGQMIEGMLLTPVLVGDRIGLHPVAVIFAVMAGGQLFGFFGVLLALPVAAVVMVLLRDALSEYRRSAMYALAAERDSEH